MRADIDEDEPRRVYRRKDEPWIRSLGTVSPDGRYYAGGVVVGEGWKNFGIALVDLKEEHIRELALDSAAPRVLRFLLKGKQIGTVRLRLDLTSPVFHSEP